MNTKFGFCNTSLTASLIALVLGGAMLAPGCLDSAYAQAAAKTSKKELAALLFNASTAPRVIISTHASLTEKFAAGELATYLQKMSGHDIAVESTDEISRANEPRTGPVIIVGVHPANADLKPDKLDVEESVIDVSAGRIRIVGGRRPAVKMSDGSDLSNERGTLYGVYEFLDNLGVRWYRPEPWGEFVPRSEEVRIAVKRQRIKPAFRYRWSLNSYRYWKEDTPQQTAWARLWATRNRQNTNLWTEPEKGGYHVLQTSHIYAALFPPDKYFATHPEYYALIDGKRRRDGQLCLGNPEVQKLAIEKILQFAKTNPEYESYSLEPNDDDNWCQCPLCRAMDDPKQKSIFSGATVPWERPMGEIEMSNRVSAFGCLVAHGVQQRNKNLRPVWLAYSTHSEPPSLVKKLPSNVLIMAAAFSSAFTNPENSYSDYSRDLYDPRSRPNRNFLRVLQGYGKMAPIIAREYWSGIAWVGPMPLIGTMQDRLKAYRRLSLEGLYNEVHPHWGPQGIDMYFMTRLMWNPDLDVKKELDLYCKNYYGPAAAPMKEYHLLLENAAHAGIPHYSFGVGTHAVFTPSVVKRMGELMQQAKSLIANRAPYSKRFEGVWAGYEYVRLVTPYYDFLAKGDKLEAAKAWERANKLILSYKDGDVFDNGTMFGSLQFFGNYNLNIPKDIQAQAKQAVAGE